MAETVVSVSTTETWIDRVRAWFAPPPVIRRIDFVPAPVAALVWPQAAVAALAHALTRAIAQEAAATIQDTVVDAAVVTAPHPIALQLAMQARRNVPKGRSVRPLRIERVAQSCRAKPTKIRKTPKRAVKPPVAWIAARHAARR